MRRDLLRAELVDTVGETPRRAPRHSSRRAIAAVVGFGIAGALTGGAVSGAFASDAGRDPADVTVSAGIFAESILGSHAQTFGAPMILSGQGSLSLDLGERPEGATSLLLITACVDAGTIRYGVDGERLRTSPCTDEGGEVAGGSGGLATMSGDGTHTLQVSGTGRYVIYAAWAADEQAEPSDAHPDTAYPAH